MAYTPTQGDIVWLDLSPQAGHEQAGRRPCLIVWGDDALSVAKGLAQVCPISNTDNGFPLHVPLDEVSKDTKGFVLCEHSKTVDLTARNVEFKDRVSEEVLHEVLSILHSLLD